MSMIARPTALADFHTILTEISTYPLVNISTYMGFRRARAIYERHVCHKYARAFMFGEFDLIKVVGGMI